MWSRDASVITVWPRPPCIAEAVGEKAAPACRTQEDDEDPVCEEAGTDN
jgi:hypothetical protein